MIKITLKNGDVKKFNLKDYDRERGFKDAWYSMHGDEKYDGKKMRITTSEGTTDYYINDIMECEFDDAIHVNVEVTDGPPKQKEEPKEDEVDSILNRMDNHRKAQTQKFINAIRARGIEPDMNDSMFMNVLESVQKDTSDFKFPMYVNLYCASKGV
jgi:hypothetical protein